jgi:hypothetical protein
MSSGPVTMAGPSLCYGAATEVRRRTCCDAAGAGVGTCIGGRGRTRMPSATATARVATRRSSSAMKRVQDEEAAPAPAQSESPSAAEDGPDPQTQRPPGLHAERPWRRTAGLSGSVRHLNNERKRLAFRVDAGRPAVARRLGSTAAILLKYSSTRAPCRTRPRTVRNDQEETPLRVARLRWPDRPLG